MHRSTEQEAGSGLFIYLPIYSEAHGSHYVRASRSMVGASFTLWDNFVAVKHSTHCLLALLSRQQLPKIVVPSMPHYFLDLPRMVFK